MTKIIQKPILELDTTETISLSKTIDLLQEIAKNEEMRDWYENNIDQNLMDTIESLENLFNKITIS